MTTATAADDAAVLHLAGLEAQLHDLRRTNRALHKQLEREAARQEFRLASAGQEEFRIRPPKKLAKSRRAGVPVLLASDWHVEERVDPCHVNGTNAYDLGVAKRRAERFFQGAAAKVQLAQYEYDCRSAILWAGGDFVTGHIHESGEQTNQLSPPEAARYWKGLFRAGIEMLLEELPRIKLLVVCSYGNHGRITKKPLDSSLAAANSFEVSAYYDLAELFERTPRVDFRVAQTALEYVQVYDWTLRFTHGDKGMSYRGGLGGIGPSARRAVEGWNTGRRADVTVLGHWHQWVAPFPDVAINGSLIGYNSYALDIRAPWEPPQQGFFVLDAERGRRHTESIWVSRYGARRP